MFRNNYDNDSVTFSPQGRIFQVEYAGEAVKQGSVVVGIRNAEELSSYQKKLFAIDEHVGIAIAGLTSDARVLSNFMKTQSMQHTMVYGRHMPLHQLASLLGEKAQLNTQHYGKRPYGVGLLVAGVDDKGTHLYEFQPSGMAEEMVAFAIGARSQMARTYLERNIEKFADCGREELVMHGLKALKESLVQDKELTVDNTSVGVVGLVKDDSTGRTKVEPFKVHDGRDVKDWIDAVSDDKDDDDDDDDDEEEETTTSAAPAAGGDSMEVDS
ncbi:proteasome subunit alpha type-1 [Zalerion maritima]|uniref:Proteasome subunit alpha type n=1 Tax=Zalerion maritima TaxID=339359 RepID=A0AAD5RWQ3_9PEZI|nr:proteasome subunit alpha type-1 [Zalerion maritima]